MPHNVAEFPCDVGPADGSHSRHVGPLRKATGVIACPYRSLEIVTRIRADGERYREARFFRQLLKKVVLLSEGGGRTGQSSDERRHLLPRDHLSCPIEVVLRPLSNFRRNLGRRRRVHHEPCLLFKRQAAGQIVCSLLRGEPPILIWFQLAVSI